MAIFSSFKRFLKRLFRLPTVFIWESVGNQLWGFKPTFIKAFVAQKGIIPSSVWFAKNLPPYQRILESWGPIRTHLIATELSVLNGCPYFTHGHGYALELHYLKQYNAPFPLSERDFLALIDDSEDNILATFERALTEASLEEAIFDLRRMAELRRIDTLLVTQRDRDLLHLIHMFDMLTASGRQSQPRFDLAHDPISKNRALRDRYAALRQFQNSNLAKPSLAMAVAKASEDLTVLNPADIYEYDAL
jgi:hypothetical protein